ncbi:MAG: hypothetical protein V2I97_18450 [Desulfococcaceae bacterium]|jgi:hypothetical protein|nr:hypothetical protein [Desulfococcaceae bacterium]
MKKGRTSGSVIGLFFILTLWSVGTAETKGYPVGVGLNGAVGTESPDCNPGSPAGNGGGSRRCGETAGSPVFPGPELDNKGRGGGRVRKQKKGNKKRHRAKPGSKKRKKISVLPTLSSYGNYAGKVTKRKKKSVTKKTAEKAAVIAGKLMGENCKNKTEVIRIERVDDVPLLLAVMMRMKLHTVPDDHTPEHWKQRDLSWGLTCIIWLAYILSEGDHRRVSVREYVGKWDTPKTIVLCQSAGGGHGKACAHPAEN